MDYNEAEKMIQRVALVMSSIANDLIPKRTDNSHTNLRWDDFRKTLLSRMFVVNGGTPLFMSFNPSSFMLSFMTSDNRTMGETSAEDLTARELLEWCEDWLYAETGFNGVLYPIQTTSSDIWDIVIRRPHDEFLFVWLALRTQANRILQTLNSITGQKTTVAIKSEKLESVAHYPIRQDHGQEVYAIEAGLSMSPETGNKPFYFVRIAKSDKKLDTTNLPETKHVHWVSGDWNGAMYQIFDVEKFPSTADVTDFMEKTYSLLNKHAMVGK